MTRQRVFVLACLFVLALVALVPLTASAANWSAPFVLGSGNKFPTVAIDSMGKIHFAWWNNNANTIEYRVCGMTENSCSDTETLSAPGVESYYPSLAIDPADNPNVVWEAKSGDTNYAVFFRRKVGKQWEPIRRVSKPNEPYAEIPDLAIDAGGKIHVSYQTKSGGSASVYYSASSDAETFTNSMTVATVAVGADWAAAVETLQSDLAPTGKQVSAGLFPRIALDGAGTPYIVWNVPSPYGIYYSYRDGSGWSSAIRVAQGHKDQTADIAVTSDGRVGVVWVRGDTFDVSFALFQNGKQQSRSNKVGAGNEWSMWPRVALDCNNTFHLVFQASPSPDPGHNWNVYHRAYDGASWAPIETISRASSQEQVPAIAVTNVGGVIFSDGATVRASTADLGIGCGAPPPTTTDVPPPPTAVPTATASATKPAPPPTAAPTSTVPPTAPPATATAVPPLPTATATVSLSAGGIEHISADDPRIVYTGKWRAFQAKKATDNSYRRCGGVRRCKKGASAELEFVGGTRVEWETVYANTYGIVKVYLDGKLFEQADLCRPHHDSPFPRYGQRTYLLQGDGSTAHSIRIVALGRHSRCSDYRSNYVALDGFNIIR